MKQLITALLIIAALGAAGQTTGKPLTNKERETWREITWKDEGTRLGMLNGTPIVVQRPLNPEENRGLYWKAKYDSLLRVSGYGIDWPKKYKELLDEMYKGLYLIDHWRDLNNRTQRLNDSLLAIMGRDPSKLNYDFEEQWTDTTYEPRIIDGRLYEVETGAHPDGRRYTTTITPIELCKQYWAFRIRHPGFYLPKKITDQYAHCR